MMPITKSKIVYVYSEKDGELVSELDKHLITLKRQGYIESWHPGMLKGGDYVDAEIEKHLDEADIILLLLSVDFLNSVHVYEVQMKHAMERQQEGTVRVIPIMLRAADYQDEPFGKLKALPKDTRPISGRSDSERDMVWTGITRSIKDVLGGVTDYGGLDPARTFRILSVIKMPPVLLFLLLLLSVLSAKLMRNYVFSQYPDNTEFSANSQEEFISILESRARMIARTLPDKEKDDFLQLHKENCEAIKKKQWIRSHELTRRIHEMKTIENFMTQYMSAD